MTLDLCSACHKILKENIQAMHNSPICMDHEKALQEVSMPMDTSGKSCLLPSLHTMLCPDALCWLSAGGAAAAPWGREVPAAE